MSGKKRVLSDCPGLGCISICTCGSVHVKIGPVELTLEAAAFAQSALMFRQALEAMKATEADELTTRPTGSLLTH
jgi:tRNA1(Val) A37 N6-methylase TrmN6